MNVRKMGHRLVLMVVAALAGGLVSALVATTVVLADEPLAAAAQPRLEVSVQLSSDAKLPDYLTATLRDVKGQALSEQTVTFATATRFMGQEWIDVGRAATDASGVARLPVALEDRTYTVRARYSDEKGSVLAEAISQIVGPRGVREVVPDSSSPLAAFSFWMPRVIGAAVLLVWALLAGVLVLSVRRIRQGRAVVDEG